MTVSGSPILDALGDDEARMRSEVRAHFTAPGASVGGNTTDQSEQTRALRVSGQFEVAGSRRRFLMRLMRRVVGPGMMLTNYERDVPFDSVNVFEINPGGGAALRTTRQFRFRGGAERLTNVTTAGPKPGTVTDVLGDRGRFEMTFACEVSDRGGLRMRSQSSRLLLGATGRFAVPLLGPFGLSVSVAHEFDQESGRQRIAVRARSPILGTLVEYRGSFT